MELNFCTSKDTARNLLILLEDDLYYIDVILGLVDKQDMIDALFALRDAKKEQITAISAAMEQ